jgi:mRNA-degrading endonuclease HigB of HigAB toxin-antitoxin module
LKNNTIRIKINVELDNNYMDIQKDINFTFPNKLKNKIRFGIYITNLKGGGAQRVTALLLNYIQDIKIFDIFLFTLNIVEKGEYKTPDKIKRIFIKNENINDLIK